MIVKDAKSRTIFWETSNEISECLIPFTYFFNLKSLVIDSFVNNESVIMRHSQCLVLCDACI